MAACWRSTATRTASTRSAATTAPPVVAKFYRPGRWTDAGDPRGARVRAGAGAGRDPGRRARGRTRAHAVRARRLPLRACIRAQGGHWPELGDPRGPALDGALPGAHPRGRPHAAVPPPRRGSTGACMGGETADYLLEAGWIPPHIEAAYASRGGRCAGDRGAALRRGDAVPHAAPARRLPPRQRAVDRRRPALRGPRRLHDGPRRAGPVDAAVGRPEEMQRQLHDLLEGYGEFARLRLARTLADRAAAHAAHHALRRLARAALGRSGVSARLPVVRGAEVLGAARARPARADRGDGGAAAQRADRCATVALAGVGSHVARADRAANIRCHVQLNPRHRRRRLHRQPRRPPARRARRARRGPRQPVHRLPQRGARRAAGRGRHRRSRDASTAC